MSGDPRPLRSGQPLYWWVDLRAETPKEFRELTVTLEGREVEVLERRTGPIKLAPEECLKMSGVFSVRLVWVIRMTPLR